MGKWNSGARRNKQNDMDIEGVLAITLTFATAFGVVYIVFTTRHRERMAMIEKGIDPGIPRKRAEMQPDRALNNGMKLIAVAVGLGVGYVLQRYAGVPEPWTYIGPVVFFLGVASLITYLRGRKEL